MKVDRFRGHGQIRYCMGNQANQALIAKILVPISHFCHLHLLIHVVLKSSAELPNSRISAGHLHTKFIGFSSF